MKRKRVVTAKSSNADIRVNITLEVTGQARGASDHKGQITRNNFIRQVDQLQSQLMQAVHDYGFLHTEIRGVK